MNLKSESLFHKHLLSSWLCVRRCYAINYSFFEMKSHLHPELEIMYAVHGSCKVFCWNHSSQMEEILLKEGEYIFLDSNTPHQLEVTKESPCRILNLEIGRTEKRNGFELSRFAGISDSLRELLDTPRHALRASDHSGSLCHIITELQKQFVNRLDQSEYNIESDLLLSQLFIEMSRQINRKQISFRGSIYVKRALQYIDKNYERDLTVEEISDYSGISLSYMQKLFKEQTGISLIDKINAFRIEKAKLLLETSSLPVIDIAVTVGFHNRQHFTYIFTKITGCSPSLYRKQKGNNQLFLGFH